MYNHICWLKISLKEIFYNILSVRIITLLIILFKYKKSHTFKNLLCKMSYIFNHEIKLQRLRINHV